MFLIKLVVKRSPAIHIRLKIKKKQIDKERDCESASITLLITFLSTLVASALLGSDCRIFKALRRFRLIEILDCIG